MLLTEGLRKKTDIKLINQDKNGNRDTLTSTQIRQNKPTININMITISTEYWKIVENMIKLWRVQHS